MPADVIASGSATGTGLRLEMTQTKSRLSAVNHQQKNGPLSVANDSAKASPGAVNDAFKDIEKLEKDLWEAADNLRANSKLTSSDYFMPVLGVISWTRAHCDQKWCAGGMGEGTAKKMPRRGNLWVERASASLFGEETPELPASGIKRSLLVFATVVQMIPDIVASIRRRRGERTEPEA
jgi:hypothetical protein